MRATRRRLMQSRTRRCPSQPWRAWWKSTTAGIRRRPTNQHIACSHSGGGLLLLVDQEAEDGHGKGADVREERARVVTLLRLENAAYRETAVADTMRNVLTGRCR